MLFFITWYESILVCLINILTIVCILMIVAWVTVIERKVMAYMQRRVGPNNVGYVGQLQAFADAAKLILKEMVFPNQSQIILFFFAPVISLFISLISWSIVPFTEYYTIYSNSVSIIISLCIGSIGIFGIVFAGWSANSKYTYLATIRSTAQMISYELVFSCIIMMIMFIAFSFNFYDVVYSQIYIYNVWVFCPFYIIFWITILAETGRPPFDLIEAESELVSGYMTEHSSTIFVFFFLAEYSNIVYLSTIISIFFFGGFIFTTFSYNFYYFSIQSFIIGLKSIFSIVVFVWVRATLPRIKFDQLMQFCWMDLLPITIGFISFIFSIFVLFILNILLILNFNSIYFILFHLISFHYFYF